MQKLDSVKKPKSLINKIITLSIVISVVVFLLVTGLIIFSYFKNNKTSITDDMVFPILRSILLIFPIESLLVFVLLCLLSSNRLFKKKEISVSNASSLFDLSRSDYLLVDENVIFQNNKCQITEIVPLGNKNRNEIIDIVGSMAASLISTDPVINALQQFSYIPLFNGVEVKQEDGYYSASYKDKKYVLGKPGSFKYRAEELVKTKIEPYQLKGYEITLVGIFEKDRINGKYAEFADVFGVIVSKNEIKTGFKKTIEYFQNKGIEIRYVTDGNAIIASEHAKNLGINSAGRFVSVGVNTPMDEQLVKDFVVYGNMKEEDRRTLISLLQKDGKIVSCLSNGEYNNSECMVSLNENGDISVKDHKDFVDAYEESELFADKAKKLFVIGAFKLFLVDLFILVVTLLSLFGLKADYRPVVIGDIFVIFSLVGLLFTDKGRISNRQTLYKLFISSGLSVLMMIYLFIMYILQYNGVTYTGFNDIDVCLSVGGISFALFELVLLFDICRPFKKNSIILLATLSIVTLGALSTLWGVSVYLNKDITGLCFNKFNGQNIISVVIITIMFISVYYVVVYLLDNLRKGDDRK